MNKNKNKNIYTNGNGNEKLMNKNKSIITLENVSYKYNDKDAIDYVFKNLSYEFSLGKVYAIRGKSGSGKTTLLSLICGLETRYEGKIYFEDKDLSKINLDHYRNSDIGIVFQSYNLLPHLTAEENIILSMDINGNNMSKSDKHKRSIELLKSVGLSEKHASRRILRLSGGEQQRVAIARSLSYNSKVIIADEPTGNLDHETENEILDILKNLAKNQSKCIIIVTHSENVCSKADVIYELLNKKEKGDDKNDKKKGNRRS